MKKQIVTVNAHTNSGFDVLANLIANGWVKDPDLPRVGVDSAAVIPMVFYESDDEIPEELEQIKPEMKGPIEFVLDFPINKVDTYEPGSIPQDPLNLALQDGYEELKSYAGKMTLVRRGAPGRRVNLVDFVQFYLAGDMVNVEDEVMSPVPLAECQKVVYDIWSIHVSLEDIEFYNQGCKLTDSNTDVVEGAL